MICKIYRTTFEMNHSKKIKKALASFEIAEPLRVFEPYGYYRYKPSHMIPLLQPYNFHFSEWEECASGFDPNNGHHWNMVFGYTLKNNLDFVYEPITEWMPKDCKELLMTSYTVYKLVDENGRVIDARPYIEAWVKSNREWRTSHSIFFGNTEYDENDKYCCNQYLLRRPKTKNEMKQQMTSEDKRYLKENGYVVKERACRRQLPDESQDLLICTQKSWKEKTKHDKQWKHNKFKKEKIKSIRGFYK